MSEAGNGPLRVWDLPTRIFHWGIVILIGISWWSAEQDAMDWHQLSGIAVLGLVAFRIMWGFWGGSTARFSHFLAAPKRAIGWLRARPGAAPAGHNPIGGYSTIAMIALLAVQVSLGLFAVDIDGIESGPLSFLVSFETGRTAASLHHKAFTALQVLIGIHLLALLYYTVVARQRLIARMVTGVDRDPPAGAESLRTAPFWRFLATAAAALLLALWIKGGLAF